MKNTILLMLIVSFVSCASNQEVQEVTLSPSQAIIEDSRIQFNVLIQELIAANKEGRDRSAIISELNAMYADLIIGVNLETASQAQLVGLLQLINERYEAKIKLAGAKDRAAEAERQLANAEKLALEERRNTRQLLVELGVPAEAIADLDLSTITTEEEAKEVAERLIRKINNNK